MSNFYFDSSALAKRYLQEIGTAWIRALTDLAAGHTTIVAEITQVEIATALAARYRSGSITLQERDNAVDLLAEHCNDEYRLISIDRATLDQAVALTQRHRLRGYDAVQLAAALVAESVLRAAGLPSLIFITADTDLLAAARAEGLTADDPNLHP